MQKKLKFLPSHTIRDIPSHHINKSIPHCTLNQLFDNNFNNIRDHSDLMPTTAMMQELTVNQMQQQAAAAQLQQNASQGIQPNQNQPSQMQGIKFK